MSAPSPLVGVLLVGETQASKGQIIGTAYLPTAARQQTLRQLRTSLVPALPTYFRDKSYLFLTPRNWEISRSLEESVLAGDVLDQDSCLRIHVDYAKPRIGIVAERECSEGGDIPLGFVFCELGARLHDLATQIVQDLVPSYPFLGRASFSFVDRNGWPISSTQEVCLTVLDVISDHQVRIRLSRQLEGDASLGASSVHRLGLQAILSPSIPSIEPAIRTGPFSAEVPREGGAVLTRDRRVDEILISYVHSEATLQAVALKHALQTEGYNVFLDIDSIEGGTDWQDALNEAISRCSLFVALVTMRYGYTLWTNREVKMADILGKSIIPVNFLSNWPPACLAIQFATTQYTQWEQPVEATESTDNAQVDNEKATPPGASCSETAAAVAKAIIQCYKKEEPLSTANINQVEEVDGDAPNIHLQPTSTGTKTTGKPPVKSCPSLLPNSVPKDYQWIIQQPRSGKPLVVIVCHLAQMELARTVAKTLEDDGSEVWSTCDEDGSALEEIHAKINEAGVVVMMFSEEFVKCCKCQAKVFYSEQRKRIIPLLIGSVCLPDWAAMLVGTNVFVDSRSSGFISTVLNKVHAALSPKALEQELAMAAKEKEELDTLCAELAQKLPKGKLVYISGGTNFYSPLGKAICTELGVRLAKERDVVLITGGFYGVGETVARSFYDERVRLGESGGLCHIVAVKDDQDRSHQTRQRPDKTFEALPFGTTFFSGSSVRQREMLTPRLLDLCVLVEGGPGAAFEVQQFNWNEKYVIPVAATGGAASGLFEVPQSIFQRPQGVCESDWSLLSNHSASPSDIADAIVRIVSALTAPQSERKTDLNRSDTEIVFCEETTVIGRKRSYVESH